MINEIGINVLANLISALLITMIGLITFSAIFLVERQKLLRFLGVNRRAQDISIYVSRLEIKPGGTTGFENLTKGYHGPGIIRIEYKGALLVRDLLYLRFIARLPNSIKRIITEKYITLANIDPSIDVSPSKLDEIPDHNLILLGSSIYNLATKEMLKQSSSEYEFFRKENGALSLRLRRECLEIPGREAGRELGIIERINDTRKGRTTFICAGLGASATYGCARYLAENWRHLRRYYKENEFSLCLAFPNQKPNDDKVTDAIVLFRSDAHMLGHSSLTSRKKELLKSAP